MGLEREKRMRWNVIQRVMRWLDAMPFPPLAIEIAAERISGVRWSRAGSVEQFASESLPTGVIVASAVDANVVDAEKASEALYRVCKKLNSIADEEAALLLPDPVVRVFVQHFQELPKSPQETLPMLRWKLKKSVPFEMDETVLSYVRQPSRAEGVDVVAAVARLSIVREYETLAQNANLLAGVISSSSMAALALLDEQRPTLFARIAGKTLTTAIVRDGVLCGYRCTDLAATGDELAPQMLLDEIFPIAAYYQDSWQTGFDSMRIAGLGARLPEFMAPIENEFHFKVQPLVNTDLTERCTQMNAAPLVRENLDGLVGWMVSRD